MVVRGTMETDKETHPVISVRGGASSPSIVLLFGSIVALQQYACHRFHVE